MELSEDLKQIKKSLAKLSKSPLLHLTEAAELLHIDKNNLAELMRQGKVRGFKVGEHWFMEEAWAKDFRDLVKKSLAVEINNLKKSNAPHHQDWVRPLAPRRKLKLRLQIYSAIIFPFKIAAMSLALVFLCVLSSIFCLPLARVGLNRHLLAENFLQLTFNAYQTPIVYSSRLSFIHQINDEKLTHIFYQLAGKNPPGQVAGAYEINIR